MNEWYLFQGKGTKKEELTKEEVEKLRETIKKIDSPPWRQFGKVEDLIINNSDGEKRKDSESLKDFAEKLDYKRFQQLIDLADSKDKEREIKKGKNFRLSDSQLAKEVRDAVNAAIYLRRPLLVTGNPGSGKTSLAF